MPSRKPIRPWDKEHPKKGQTEKAIESTAPPPPPPKSVPVPNATPQIPAIAVKNPVPKSSPPTVPTDDDDGDGETWSASGPASEYDSPNDDMLSWDQQAAIFEAAITQNQLQLLSQQLGVPEKALRKVRVGWNGARGAYTIPEYDGFGQVCGISLRLESGKKGFIAGGNRGLILPRDWYEKCEEMMFVPEGASDVAELVGMELTAIGRPSCGGKRSAAL